MASQTYPIMIKGCSQFIVEFAGDFVGQNPTTGGITSLTPDGQIDFTVDPRTGAHKIRWYGFPRDPSDEGKIGVCPPAGSPPPGSFNSVNYQYGVCPLVDTMQQDAADWNALNSAINSSSNPHWSLPEHWAISPQNYSNSFLPAHSTTPSNGPSGTQGLNYQAAWGVDTYLGIAQPKMIRITFGIDDPEGHLSTTQMYEYVFTLP